MENKYKLLIGVTGWLVSGVLLLYIICTPRRISTSEYIFKEAYDSLNVLYGETRYILRTNKNKLDSLVVVSMEKTLVLDSLQKNLEQAIIKQNKFKLNNENNLQNIIKFLDSPQYADSIRTKYFR